MCEEVCREWRNISVQTRNTTWFGMWMKRGWTAPGALFVR